MLHEEKNLTFNCVNTGIDWEQCVALPKITQGCYLNYRDVAGAFPSNEPMGTPNPDGSLQGSY